MTDDLPNDPGAVIVRRYGLRPPLDWGKDCDAIARAAWAEKYGVAA